MEAMGAIVLKGICASYFENHVSPVLKSLQQSQEQINKQLEEMTAKLQEVGRELTLKANKDELPNIADLGKVSRTPSLGEHSVSVLSRLQELSSTVQKKADSSEISRLSRLVEQRLSQRQSRDVSADATQMDSVATLIDQKLDALREPTMRQLAEMTARVEKFAASLEQKAESREVPTLTQWQELRAQMPQPAVASSAPKAEEKSDLKKMQMLVAAAGARFDRQLKELRQQLREMKEREQKLLNLEEASPRVLSRWPGRVLRSDRDPACVDDDSDLGSDVRSHSESMTGSLAGSVTGLGPEERAELQKIQAVVGAAGTAFSREIHDLKKQMRQVRSEVSGVKEHLQLPASAGA